MKKLIISLLILVASAMSASVYAESLVFEGTIGKYKIHMVLDENQEGYYYYDHRPESRFELIKTRESACSEDEEVTTEYCVRMTLQEYAPGTNKNTGEFVGVLSINYGRLLVAVTYEGYFRNKTTGKTMPFEVMYAEEVVY